MTARIVLPHSRVVVDSAAWLGEHAGKVANADGLAHARAWLNTHAPDGSPLDADSPRHPAPGSIGAQYPRTQRGQLWERIREGRTRQSDAYRAAFRGVSA